MTRLRVAKPFSRAIRKFPMKGVIHRNGLSTLGASDAHANRGQSAGVGPGSWRCRVSREALCRRQGWRPELTLPETIAQRGVGPMAGLHRCEGCRGSTARTRAAAGLSAILQVCQATVGERAGISAAGKGQADVVELSPLIAFQHFGAVVTAMLTDDARQCVRVARRDLPGNSLSGCRARQDRGDGSARDDHGNHGHRCQDQESIAPWLVRQRGGRGWR